MNTIAILHREQTMKDVLHTPTPILSKYYFQSLINGCWCSNRDGHDRFRIKGDTVEFSSNVDYQDVQASMEILKIKGVKEILPQGTDDFLFLVHEAGMEKDIEVVHPDAINEVEKEIADIAKLERKPKARMQRRRIE